MPSTDLMLEAFFMTKLTVDIPDALMFKLNSAADSVQETIIKALEQYLQANEVVTSDITQTRTWQLCGSLEVPEAESEYVVGFDEQGKAITNYAEHVDELLYKKP